MSVLAINGGKPIRTKPFREYNPFGRSDREAVIRVIDSGCLSGFAGAYGDEFYGGPNVRRLEQAWAEAYGAKHVVSSNSATSSLYSALAALQIGPGDEVIVTPFTMSATITAIVFNHAVPVFVDVESDTFNLDPDKIEAAITPRTRAIMVVHLFGHPADMPAIMNIARRHRIRVVEDNAQSIDAKVGGRLAGTFGDIGVFSLNRHKLIQSGEGGIALTDDDELAIRLRLVRNHGENAAEEFGLRNASHVIGFNFRMTELDAAVAYEQFIKRERTIANVVAMAELLDDELKGLPGIEPVAIRQGFTHTRMHHTLLYDVGTTGVDRDLFVRAVQAEGIPIWAGYVTPQYMQPFLQQKNVFGITGCPLRCPHYEGTLQDFGPGLCPVAEELHAKMINSDLHRPPNTADDMRDIAAAFRKVCENIQELAA
jgi:dTDP-4-amino-4,6-dideoxygalactose transaminase